MCVAGSDMGASKTLLSCGFASPPQHNGGGAQALRLGPLLMSYQRDAIASLAALAAADALAGAGRALSTSRSGTGGTSRTSRTGIGMLRVLAAAAATSATVGAASLAGVQRAIPVLGAATRAARTRPVGGRSRTTTR